MCDMVITANQEHNLGSFHVVTTF